MVVFKTDLYFSWKENKNYIKHFMTLGKRDTMKGSSIQWPVNRKLQIELLVISSLCVGSFCYLRDKNDNLILQLVFLLLYHQPGKGILGHLPLGWFCRTLEEYDTYLNHFIYWNTGKVNVAPNFWSHWLKFCLLNCSYCKQKSIMFDWSLTSPVVPLHSFNQAEQL